MRWRVPAESAARRGARAELVAERGAAARAELAAEQWLQVALGLRLQHRGAEFAPLRGRPSCKFQRRKQQQARLQRRTSESGKRTWFRAMSKTRALLCRVNSRECAPPLVVVPRQYPPRLCPHRHTSNDREPATQETRQRYCPSNREKTPELPLHAARSQARNQVPLHDVEQQHHG